MTCCHPIHILCAVAAAACAMPSQAMAQHEPLNAPPDLGRTHAAALKFHGLSGDLDRWSRRARLSNLVPTLEVHTARQNQHDADVQYREDQRFEAAELAHRDSVRNELERKRSRRHTYGVKLRFDLGAVIYDPREMQAARHTRQLALQRARLLDQVSERYFEREQLLLQATRTPPTDTLARAALLLEMRRHDARLDALTGGWWSAQLASGGPS